jgi:hypothetical protein
MRGTSILTAVILGVTTVGWSVSSYSQTVSTAKVCGFLPTAELEAHFGARVSVIRGSDTSSVSMCSVDFHDRKHGADLMSQPQGPVSLDVEQRRAALRQQLERRGSQIKSFSSVACFTDHIDISETRLPTTACFQTSGGYLSLSLRSEDPKHLSFAAVKQLLEKAAARRK